jgi:hypothetical protein
LSHKKNFTNLSEDLATVWCEQEDLQNLHFPNHHEWFINNYHQDFNGSRVKKNEDLNSYDQR